VAQHRFPLTVREKQRIMFINPLPAPQLTSWGDRYREAGLLHDALEFYQAARNTPALEALMEQALSQADLVLLLNLYRALEREPERAKLAALQDRASASGKESVAARASSLIVSAR